MSASVLIFGAAASLLGVVVGGLITNFNQKKERRNRRIREQLSFYSTLVAIKMEIDVRTTIQEKSLKLNKVAREEDLQIFGDDDPSSRAQVLIQRLPSEERSDGYYQEQYKSEIIPRYKKMLAYWGEHMDLPEPSTVKYYKDLAVRVASWDRAENNGYAFGVGLKMENELPNLDPMFNEFDEQMKQLQNKLKEPGFF
jgi:hypothetical protein